MYRGRPFLIRKRVNMHRIGNHERRIESKSEMTDDLVVVRLILIFFNEISRTRKCDLIDIFFDLVRSHA